MQAAHLRNLGHQRVFFLDYGKRRVAALPPGRGGELVFGLEQIPFDFTHSLRA